MIQRPDLLSDLEPSLTATDFLSRIRKKIHASRDSTLRTYCDVLSPDPCGPLRAASLPKDWNYENWIGRVEDLASSARWELETPGYNGMTCYEAGYASCLRFELARIEWNAMDSMDVAICAPVVLAARQGVTFDEFILYLAGTLREPPEHALDFDSPLPRVALAVAVLTNGRRDLRSLHTPCAEFLVAQAPDRKGRRSVRIEQGNLAIWRELFGSLPADAMSGLSEYVPTF